MVEGVAANYAEKLPNKHRLSHPPCMTKTYVYGVYNAKENQPHLSKSQFQKLWKRDLPFINIPKVTKKSK
jgi:hypothetical protein